MTDMIIDKPKAIELLERAVAEKGADYVDPNAATPWGCAYQRGGRPACIIGHVYSYAGATERQLRAMDISDPLQDESDFPIETSQEAAEAFFEAQNIQDGGGTWGQALEAAKAI